MLYFKGFFFCLSLKLTSLVGTSHWKTLICIFNKVHSFLCFNCQYSLLTKVQRYAIMRNNGKKNLRQTFLMLQESLIWHERSGIKVQVMKLNFFFFVNSFPFFSVIPWNKIYYQTKALYHCVTEFMHTCLPGTAGTMKEATLTLWDTTSFIFWRMQLR